MLELGSLLNMSEIDQNKPKLGVNYSNLERNTTKFYICIERGDSALQRGVEQSAVYGVSFEL